MRGLLKGYSYLNANRFFYSNISLKFDSPNHAAYLTLTNEKKRNPMSLETIKEIRQALSEVSSKVENEKLKILILKGDGPAFSAGHDLKQLKASSQPHKIFQEFTQSLLSLKRLPIVTLCGINGIAAAGGFQLALSCDLIVATQKSSFSCPGVKWGLFCSTPGVQLIRSISSEKKAKEMLLFGQSITANQAFQYGLVNKVVKGDQFDNQIKGYIDKVGQLSGEVIALGKKVFNEQVKLDLEEAYCVATSGMKENIEQKSDCQEGLSAFAEKRHPHFKN